jgi:hypothetical protein
MKKFRVFSLAALALFFVLAPRANSQTVSGQISGVVVDAQNAAVAGANVEVTSTLTQTVRTFRSEATGGFLFPGLTPGNYHVKVTHPGFKTYTQNNVIVGAQERVDLHSIKLEIGDLGITVTVEAQTARVATDSSDRSTALNLRQLEDIPTAGRAFTDVMRSLPSATMTNTTDLRGGFVATPQLNGGNGGQILVMLDGVASQDGGTFGFNGALSPSIDSIGEVKVLTSNYGAEYGVRAGGQVNVSFKNGTSQFHGSLYHYYRHESFNANGFINNMNKAVRTRYRYQNPGGTLGGPLIIPGTNFNRSRQKLFFFFSEDYLANKSVNAPANYTMPTLLEQSGDFSKTTTTTGAAITIKDPSTKLPFPGNVIPPTRIHPTGAAFMNLFPQPSTTDPTGLRQYNAQYLNVLTNPREDRVLRVDFGLGAKTASYFRLIQDYFGESGYGTRLAPSGGGWGQFATAFGFPSAGGAISLIHTFTPNLIDEFTGGINRSHQITAANDPERYKNSLLPLKGVDGKVIGLPSFFNVNPLGLLPNISFATTGAQTAGQGVTNAPRFGWDSRWPYEATDTLYNVTNNLTWIKGGHTVKGGIYLEFAARGSTNFSTSNVVGTYYFGTDSANPNDSGYPFANLLLGSVQAYGEDNKRLVSQSRYHHIEWFVQDSWKVNRRLSFDLGIRFQIIQPYNNINNVLNMFDTALYKSTTGGQLLYPAKVNGANVALNPVTGVTYGYARVASFDPASYPANATPYNGLKPYQGGFWTTPPLLFGPRGGFAWDVFGNGKMAVRGGFGIFYGNAMAVDTVGGLATQPPLFRAPIFYNTTFDSLLSTQGFYTPQNVTGGSPDYKNPTTYNWSFGVQRDLSKGLIFDAAYVGNLAHHGFSATGWDLNAVAPYTTWTPTAGVNTKYVDPTNSAGGLVTANLIRALAGGYAGYGTVNSTTSVGESYYHSLQVQLNRRFGQRLQMSSNYTFAKAITYSRQRWVDDTLNKASGGRKHVMNMNFGYRVPDVSPLLGVKFLKYALDGWNLNGQGSIYSGTPITVSCATPTNMPGNLGNYWTGTPTGGIPFRCQMTGNIWLPEGATPASIGSTADKRMWYPFDPSHFVLPSATSRGTGNTPPTLTFGPGMWNVDLSVNKEFRLGEEQTRALQIRLETFNTFNHFNPGNPNTTLTYNFVTGAQTTSTFGSISTNQNQPRKVAMSLRLRF